MGCHLWDPTELDTTEAAAAPNIGAPQYVRQMLTNMKGDINKNTVIVGEFNTHSHL